MNTDSLKHLTELAVRFRDERDWKQFHNPKDMAISLALEAAEVLELMQWLSGEALAQKLAEKPKRLADELADVLYWVLMLAWDQGIDLPAAFVEKLEDSGKKYPVEKSRGKASKYTEL